MAPRGRAVLEGDLKRNALAALRVCHGAGVPEPKAREVRHVPHSEGRVTGRGRGQRGACAATRPDPWPCDQVLGPLQKPEDPASG